MRLRLTLMLGVLTILVAGTAFATTFLDHDVRFDAARIATRSGPDGTVLVDFVGGSHTYESGHPDLPWVSESVDLPAGQRVVRVEILSERTEPLAAGGRLASAISPQPGSGPILRTTPDRQLYASNEFQPQQPAQVGVQGFERGRHVARLMLAPVRWQASTGRLERVSEMRLRLVLEDAPDEVPLRRERIVPEWEDGDLPAVAMRGAGAVLASMSAAARSAQPFKATQVPSVLGSPVAYVIITSDALVPQFQALADWKTQTGFRPSCGARRSLTRSIRRVPMAPSACACSSVMRTRDGAPSGCCSPATPA